MAELRLELIGTPHVYAEGVECTPGPKPTLLLAYLAVEGSGVSRSRLTELLWPGVEENKARRTLRSTLSRLRQTIRDDLIVADGDTLAIGASLAVSSDLGRLQEIADGAIPLNDIEIKSGSAPRLLHAAFLEGTRTVGSVELDDWLAGMRSRVELLQDEANERLIRELGESDRAEESHALARAWFRRDPSLDRSASALIRSASLLERTAEVRAVYEEHVRALAAMDEDVSVEVTRLYQRASGGSAEAPIAADANATAGGELLQGAGTGRSRRLPVPRDRFVGRDEVVAECRRSLRANTVLTIWAPGGAGKTRLAVELGRAIEPEFADGVFFVSLGEVDSPELVVDVTAAALGVAREPGVPLEDTVASFFADRRLVVILDNCEHVRDECARLVDIMSRDAGDSRLIATSREPLEVASERVIRLEPLSLPAEPEGPDRVDELFESAAVELFVDRATRFDPDFTLNEQTGAPVVTICRRLDGLPLALEIAAASLRTLSVHEVARSIDDRFAEIARSGRSQTGQHETIHEAIDWSYNLLSDGAARLFARLGVFPAWFSLEAVEFVCVEVAADDAVTRRGVLSLLDELVRKSLVVVRRTEGRSLFALYQLVRVFARQQLDASGATVALERRLLEWVLHMGASVVEQYYGAGRDESGEESRMEKLRLRAKRFQAELANIRAAMEYAIELSLVEEGLRLVTDFQIDWWSENLSAEALGYLKRLLPRSERVDPRVRVAAYAIAAGETFNVGEGSARPYIDEGLKLVERIESDSADPPDLATRTRIALLLWMAAMNTAGSGGREIAEKLVTVGRTLTPTAMLQSLVRAANIFEHRDDHARASELMAEAEAMGVYDHELFTLRGSWLADQERWEEATAALQGGLRNAAGPTYWFFGAKAILVHCCLVLLQALKRHAAVLGFAAWDLRVAWDKGARGSSYACAVTMIHAYGVLGDADRAVPLIVFCDALRKRFPRQLEEALKEHEAAEAEFFGELPREAASIGQAPYDGPPPSVRELTDIGLADAMRLAQNDEASKQWLELLMAAVAGDASRPQD